MARINAEKARILYACIDQSGGFYRNPVDADCRSAMNVPFVLANPDLDAKFLAESKAAGLASLKGHKSVGGMRAEVWLWPLLESVQALDAITDAALEQGLRARVPWDRVRDLDRLAAARLETPLGSAAIDYAAEGGPRVEIRVQELFGVTVHPTIGGGRMPLTLALLSPGGKPIQTTADLPGFWRGSWKEVRAEMRGRYPRHPWPEDPFTAVAQRGVKHPRRP